MGNPKGTGFPESDEIGKMYRGNVEDHNFSSEDIITWQNVAGKNGKLQILGYYHSKFVHTVISIMFWINFLQKVPRRRHNLGVRANGETHNDWISNCKPDEWFRVEIEEQNGNYKHISIMFNGIDQIQTVRIAEFKVSVLGMTDYTYCLHYQGK